MNRTAYTAHAPSSGTDHTNPATANTAPDETPPGGEGPTGRGSANREHSPATVKVDVPGANGEDSPSTVKVDVRGLNFWYGDFQALTDINLPIYYQHVTALIGASGCGKSTLLRCFNRMHDVQGGNHYQGAIQMQPEDINLIGPETDPMLVRLKIGMVFQQANPFPKSIFENVAAGLRIRGIKDRTVLQETVERSLQRAALWDEVKDRLDMPAFELSGGQQQRLCIARTLAPEPELLLLDEPTSSLDPIATAKIEDLITRLGKEVTILIVTHNMQQAARISDYTAFMHLGELIEHDDTETMFTNPHQERTESYITGRFG